MPTEFAPRKYQKFLSYVVGWLGVLGWQTGVAFSGYTAGTQIQGRCGDGEISQSTLNIDADLHCQGLIVLNYPDYVFQRWHGTLLIIAVLAFSVFFNTFLAQRLALVEGIVLVLHVFGFFGIMITLW
jgi:choline transport protein